MVALMITSMIFILGMLFGALYCERIKLRVNWIYDWLDLWWQSLKIGRSKIEVVPE